MRNRQVNAIGTQTKEQWDRAYKRDHIGRFTRDYTRGALWGIFLAFIFLALLVMLLIQQVNDARAEMRQTRQSVIDYFGVAKNELLSASLGAVKDISQDMLDMTSGSVDLTENMYEQLKVAKKLKAIGQ